MVLSLETYNPGHLSEDHKFLILSGKLSINKESKSGACRPHSGVNVWHTANKLKDFENNSEVLLKVKKNSYEG